MNIDKIIVTLSGTFLIGFIYWFFFGKKSSFAPDDAKAMTGKEAADGQNMINILIEGGYQPDVIRLKKDVKTTLILKRTDANSCLEDFIIPDLKIKKYLPLNKEVKIVLKLDRMGSWNFHCGMNMYHGKLIVN